MSSVLGRPRVSSLQIGLLCCVAALGCLAGAGIAGALPGGSSVAFLVIGMLLVPLLLVVPKEWLLAGIFIAVYGINGLSASGILPRQAAWVAEIITLAMLVRVLAEVIRNPRRRPLPAPLLGIGLAIVVGLVIALLHGQNLAALVLGIRKYAVFPTLGLCLILGEWNVTLPRLVWNSLLAVAFVQLPVSLYQLFTIGGGDGAGGTFGPGGTGLEAVFVSTVALAVLAVGLRSAARTRWYVRTGLVVLLMVALTIGGGVVAVPIVLLGIVVLLATGRGLGRELALAALGLAAVSLVAFPAAAAYQRSINFPDPRVLLSNPLLALNYGPVSTAKLELGRLDQLVLAWQTGSSGGAEQLVLGRGLYAASPSYFGQDVSGPLLAKTPRLIYVASSWGRGLLETGLAGLAAWAWLCIDCLRRGLRLRSRLGADARRFATLAIIVGVMFPVLGAYNDAWNLPASALLLWVVYAVAVRMDNEQENAVTHVDAKLAGGFSWLGRRERSARG